MPGFIRMKLTCHTDPLRNDRFTCAFTTRAPGTTNAMARAAAIRALRSLLIPCLLSREGGPRKRQSTTRDQRRGEGDGRTVTLSARSGGAGAAAVGGAPEARTVTASLRSGGPTGAGADPEGRTT